MTDEQGTAKRNIGRNRGKARIWLEGAILSGLGWERGTPFKATFEDGAIVYEQDPEGNRKVAGDDSRPIIDTNTDKILSALGADTQQVDVHVTARRIRITAAALILLASIFFNFLPAHAQKVLCGCEFSGLVRDAFRERGHDAISCDFLPSERPGDHIQGDVLPVLYGTYWDMLIAFPPCTGLSLSGARWRTDHWVKSKKAPGGRWWHDGSAHRAMRDAGLAFFRALWKAPVRKICLEQPKSIATQIAPKSQTVHPWQFGHGERKETWLWLKNLPPLEPTNIVAGREERIFNIPPGPDRWKERSRTFPGVAAAMADQWGRGAA